MTITTPRDAVEAVRRAYGLTTTGWQVTAHHDGFVVAERPTGPLPIGGGVWLVAADGAVRPFSSPAEGWPDTRRTYRVRT